MLFIKYQHGCHLEQRKRQKICKDLFCKRSTAKKNGPGQFASINMVHLVSLSPRHCGKKIIK